VCTYALEHDTERFLLALSPWLLARPLAGSPFCTMYICVRHDVRVCVCTG